MRYLYAFLAFTLIISCSNQTNKVGVDSQVFSNSDAEKIRRTFDKNKSQFYNLYLSQREIEPHLKGLLRFRLVVNQDGKVISAEVIQSELNGLEDKMISVIERMQFPAFDSKKTIDYRFQFFPN